MPRRSKSSKSRKGSTPIMVDDRTTRREALAELSGQSDPDDMHPSQNSIVQIDWVSVVTGLRAEAARALDAVHRSQLLTIAAGLTWQLVGDETDAAHLLIEAIATEPAFFSPRREQALMHLRQGEDVAGVLEQLFHGVQGLAPGDPRRKAGARALLLGIALGTRPSGGDGAEHAASLPSREIPLTDTPLGSLWVALSGRIHGDHEFCRLYRQAISECRVPALRAAMLADLATGLHSGMYLRSKGLKTRPSRELAEAVELVPEDPLYEVLFALVTSYKPKTQHGLLQRRLLRNPDDSVRLRAAAVAASLGQLDQAMAALEEVEGEEISPLMDWKLLRVATEAAKLDRASAALVRLRGGQGEPIELAAIAMEQASLSALRQNLDACLAFIEDAAQQAPELDSIQGQLRRLYLRRQSYRRLVDQSSEHAAAGAQQQQRAARRRVEILETRLGSTDEAADEYHRALEADPSDPFLQRAVARVAMAQRDYHALARHCRDRVEREQNATRKANHLHLLAQLQRFDLAQPDEAARTYAELVALDETNLNVRREHIEHLLQAGDATEAMEKVPYLLEHLTSTGQVRLLRLDWLGRCGRQLSLEQLRAAVDADPDSPLALELWEQACLAEDRLDALLDVLDESEPMPQRDARLLCAHAHSQRGDHERAVEALTSWLSDHPEDRAAIDLLRSASLGAGRLDRLRELRFTGESVSIGASELSQRFERWWDSFFEADAAETLCEGVSTPHDRRIVRAATFAALSAPNQRAEAALALLECAPDDVRLQALAEEVNVQADAHAELIRLYLTWAKKGTNADRDYLLHRLAQCYAHLGRLNDACQVWRKLQQLQPDFPPALAGQAEALLKTDEVEKAYDLFVELEQRYRFRANATLEARSARLLGLAEHSAGSLKALLFMELSHYAWEAEEMGEAFEWARLALEQEPGMLAAKRRVLCLSSWADANVTLPPDLRSDAALIGGLITIERDVDSALSAFSNAVIDRADPEAIAGLLVAARRRDRPKAVYDALEAWTHWSTDQDVLVSLDLHAAAVAELECDDVERAVGCYERALRRAPDDGWIASELARTAASAGLLSPERRDELRRALVSGSQSCSGLLVLALDSTGEERAETLVQVLDIDPGYLPAEWALLRHHRDQMPPAVLARRGRRRRCARLLTAAAEIYAKHDHLEAAESRCTEALALRPLEEVVAVGGPYLTLTALLEAQDRAVECATIGEDLMARADSKTVVHRVLETTLSVGMRANLGDQVLRGALSRLVRSAPPTWALQRRAIASARAATDWKGLLELLEKEQEMAAHGDPDLVPIISWELAEVERRRFDQPERALQRLSQAAAKSRHTEAPYLSDAIERLLVETARWDALVEHYQREIEATEDLVALARIHLEIGGIFEFDSLNGRKAFRHYQAAMAADPDNMSAILGAVRLAARTGRPGAGVEAFERCAERLPGVTADALLLRAAEITELDRKDLPRAAALYQRLKGTSAAQVAQLGLEACLLAEGRIDAFITLRKQRGAEEDPGLWVQQAAARLMSDEPELGWDSEQPAPPAIWASRIFRNPLGRQGAMAREAAQRLANQVTDATEAAELLRLGVLAGACGDGQIGGEAWRALCKEIVTLDPSDALVLLLLEAYAEVGSEEELWALDARIRSAAGGIDRADALAGLVRHYGHRGEEDRLWDTVERLQAEVPELPLSHYFRVAYRTGADEPEAAAQQFEVEAERTSSHGRRTQLLLSAAELRQRQLGQLDEAVTDLRAALQSDPTSNEAFEALREIFASQGDFAELYQLLELRYHALDDPVERMALLHRMAEIAFDRLNDKQLAAWCHTQVVTADPTQVRSYRILAEIHLEEGRFSEAAEALEAVTRYAAGKSLRVKTHLDLAQLYANEIGDPTRVVEHYRAVLVASPDHPSALKGMVEISENAANWDTAVTHLEQLSRLAPPQKRSAPLYLRLAHALERRGLKGDVARAERALWRAIELAPGDARVNQALCQFAVEYRRPGTIEAVVKRVTDRVGLDNTTPNEDHSLRLLFRLFHLAKWSRRAAAAAGVLHFLGYQDPHSEAVRTSWPIEPNRWRVMQQVPAAQTACVFPLGLSGPLVELLRLIDPVMMKIFPPRTKQLGASRRTRLGRTSEHPGVSVAHMLGRPDTEVHVCLAPGQPPVTEPGSSSPSLLLAHEVDPDAVSDAMLWDIGNSLAPAAMGFTTLARLPADEWIRLTAYVIRSRFPGFLTDEPRLGEDPMMAEQVALILPRRAAADIDPLVARLQSTTYAGLVRQYLLLRVAFGSLAALSCQDVSEALGAAAQGKGGHTLARGMIAFLLSKDFEDLQRSVGII